CHLSRRPAHPALPPSPTRRASDLASGQTPRPAAPAPATVADEPAVIDSGSPGPEPPRTTLARALAEPEPHPVSPSPTSQGDPPTPPEHTSEPQSHATPVSKRSLAR